MNLINHKTVLLALVALLMTLAVGDMSAQVYKVVDKDGNVTFTDRPPEDGAKPVDLAPISVVEAPTYKEKVKESDKEIAEANEVSLRDMRRNYRDFAIVSPQQEESIWQPENVVSVAWSVRYQLQPGMKVNVIVNGQPYTTTTERIVPIGELDRGEHMVSAELLDMKNRKIATAKPVTFYVRRPTIYNNRVRPAPTG